MACMDAYFNLKMSEIVSFGSIRKAVMRSMYLLFGIVFFGSCFNCNKYYNSRFRQIGINGVIDTTYIDKRNHNNETIMINKIELSWLTEWILGLFENAQKGDSIYKAKGSLAVYLYKPDTTLVFYPVCDGDTLK
jgi:hypothetical protein